MLLLSGAKANAIKIPFNKQTGRALSPKKLLVLRKAEKKHVRFFEKMSGPCIRLRLHVPFFAQFLSAAPLIFLTNFTSCASNTIRMHSTHFKIVRKTVQKTLGVNQALASATQNRICEQTIRNRRQTAVGDGSSDTGRIQTDTQ